MKQTLVDEQLTFNAVETLVGRTTAGKYEVENKIEADANHANGDSIQGGPEELEDASWVLAYRNMSATSVWFLEVSVSRNDILQNSFDYVKNRYILLSRRV
jgi:hypothetical protein